MTQSYPGIYPGADILTWFRVESSDIDNITVEEFINSFNTLNVTNPSSSSLDDEVEDHIYLEKQAD